MKSKSLLAFCFFLIAIGLQAQDAEGILTKYYKSIGGIEAWRKLKTMKISAKIDFGDIQTTETTYKKAPNLRRYESKSEEGNFIQTFDGVSGWEKDPYTNDGDPHPTPPEINDELKSGSISGVLIDYDKKGCTISFEGIEVVEDIETYRIKMIKANMELEYFFFDVANHFLIKSLKYEEMMGEEMETYYKDYRMVQDFKLPFLIETKLSGNTFSITRIHEYILNQDYPDELFRLY